MFRNYLISFFKRIVKYKAQFLIILLSITTYFIIFLFGFYYVNFEYSYDKFHTEGRQIFRVLQNDEDDWKSIFTCFPFGETVTDEIPEVLSFVRLLDAERTVITNKEAKIKAKKGYWVDPSFFDFFSFSLIKGDKKAINEPNSIYLEQDFAYKLMGEKDPIGEIVTFDYSGIHTLKVAGIFKVPVNSHLQFDWIRPNHDIKKNSRYTWNKQITTYTYLKLQPNANINEIENKLASIVDKYADRESKSEYNLQSLEDIYLLTDDEYKANDVTIYGNKKLISFLVLIAIFIVLILWTNLLNIIFVSINNRIKEFSLRKACGAYAHQLTRQTVLETSVIVIISSLLAIPLIGFVSDMIFQKLDILIEVNIVSGKFWLFFALASIINILVLGFFNIISLKGISTYSVSSYQKKSKVVDILKRGLIMMQLGVSIFIIIFMLIIDTQVKYMTSRDLGIEIENIILVQNPTVGKFDEGILNRGKTFMSEIVNHPNILNISSCIRPGVRYFGSGSIKFEGENMNLIFGHIDTNFISTYGLELLAGRNLSEINKPWTSILINKKFANKLGFNSPEEALNNMLVTDYGYRGNVEIVGVLEDYHQLSIDQPIEPVCFMLWPYSPNRFYSLRVKNKDPGNIIFIKSKFKEIFGDDFMFDYAYLQEVFNDQYDGVMKFRNIISILMIIIIFLCCIGLYGFFSAELSKKVKSIAMRRCLGAHTHNILYVLVENYYLSILIASVLIIPITYIIIKEWLNNFSYNIEISWWFFVKPILYMLLIVIITILHKLISALRMNTIEALKTE